jgi:DNA invertase Pin-like site-specific DNA recombinase
LVVPGIGTIHGFWASGVFAEFETNLRRERQPEGIAEAKAAGVYKGVSPQ